MLSPLFYNHDPLYAHHEVIAGNWQDCGRIAGMDRVVQRLNKFRRPGVDVQLHEWHDDFAKRARFIERHTPADRMPIVCIYAYSWGAGWGAMRLAEALAELRRPIRVYGMVLCDAVYRHAYRCGNWRAFWPGSTIRLPRNVDGKCVRAFFQRGSLLRGHKIVDACGNLVTRDEDEIEYVPTADGLQTEATHYNIDEAPPWLDACEKLARRVNVLVDRQTNWRPSFGGNLTVYRPEDEA